MKSIITGLAIVAASTAFAAPASAQFGGGLDGDGLLGAAIGAGIGGVIGSNLAAGDVQQEGTALGAVLGGVAGYAIASGGNDRGYRGHSYGGPGYYGGSYGHPGGNYYGGSRYGNYPSGYSRYGQSSRYGNQYHYQYQYNHGYQGGYQGGYVMAPPAMPAPQYIHSGQYVSSIHPGPVHTYYHVTQPQVTVQPVQYQQIQVQQDYGFSTSSCSLAGGSSSTQISGGWSDGAIPTGEVLCYSGSSARYDHMGRRIN